MEKALLFIRDKVLKALSFLPELNATQTVLAFSFSIIFCLCMAWIITPETSTALAENYEWEIISQDETIQKIDIPKMYGNQVNAYYTTEQMTSWILNKGNELISILQTLAFPFCCITFIVAVCLTLIGSLKGEAEKGLKAMATSIFGYAAILYAPMLVNIVVVFVTK